MKTRKQLKDFYLELKSSPCADCGNCFPAECMDFDHRPGEVRVNSPQKLFANEELFFAEIEKCDVVCACCHRTRTKKRGISDKARQSLKNAWADPKKKFNRSSAIKEAHSRLETRQRSSLAQKTRRNENSGS